MATQAQCDQAFTDAINKAGIVMNGGDGLSKKQVQSILDVVSQTSGRMLKKGEDVRLRGFGTIKVAKRPARKSRMGRNPATGEEIKIKAKPASKRLRVLPNKALKDIAGVK